MVDGVFFDLDGTLVDTAPDFHVILNQLLEEAGHPPLSAAAVRSQVSNGARALVTLGFGIAPGDPGFDQRLEQLLNAYEKRLDVDSTLFPGFDRVLDHLDAQNIPWGVITNKPVRFTLPVLRGLGLGDRVGPVICPDHVQHRKPDPEGLLMACRATGADPARSLYVGDHERDIAAGRNAGMLTVAATFGYIEAGDDPADWQADFMIDRAEELLDILANNPFDSTRIRSPR